ncbi:MAG: AAA family ATPase [Candidatus Aenigmatarchaeota archaeon]
MDNVYEKDTKEWLSKLGWSQNPFTLKIFPSLFVGYDDDVRELIYHIEQGHKFALILGATGSGKTTLLKSFENRLSDKKTIYLSKPPETEEIVDIFMDIFRPSIIQRLFGVNVRLHNLPEYVNDKTKSSHDILLLVDEGHEANLEALEWLRTLTDQIENMQLVMAGLNSFENYLNDKLETLLSRVTTKVELSTLTFKEVKQLIKKRIKRVGGEGYGPFTENVMEDIYERTGGFPREVLKVCDKLVTNAMKENVREINDLSSINQKEEKDEKRISGDFLKELPYKQREIIKILSKEERLLPSEVAEEIGYDNYKTKQHAVRSVNNILRRLMKGDYVTREKKGKGYVYSLSTKIRNLLVES